MTLRVGPLQGNLPSCQEWPPTLKWCRYGFSLISQDHVTLWMRAPVVNHDHGGYWHCISRDIVLVAEEQDSTYSQLNLPLLFISKRHDFKALACHINKKSVTT